jgi:hypothetical protein
MSNNLAQSNSLTDLAARIKAEHEAVGDALKNSVRHAIAAGELLIEAKAQLKHGTWLPWLKDHCGVTARSAQAYMRVARTLGAALNGPNAKRVADLSFRDSLQLLSAAGSRVSGLPQASIDRVIEYREANPRENWQRAITIVRREERHEQAHIEQKQASSQSVAVGKYCVLRHPDRAAWFTAVGPEMTEAEYKEKQTVALQTAELHAMRQKRDQLSEQATALEDEAEKLNKKARTLRKRARVIHEEIASKVHAIIGPVKLTTESSKLECDPSTDAKIAAMDDQQRAEWLLNAKGLQHLSTGWGSSASLEDRLKSEMKRRDLAAARAAKTGWTQSAKAVMAVMAVVFYPPSFFFIPIKIIIFTKRRAREACARVRKITATTATTARPGSPEPG